MQIRLTLRGPKRRAQLVVIDLTGPDVPVAVRHERPLFIVSSLPNAANRYTAFALGEQNHCSENPDQAWNVLLTLVPDAHRQVPKRVRDYLVKWKVTGE